MLETELFDEMNRAFTDGSPFVVYAMPNTDELVLLVQQGPDMHSADDLDTPGFIFAPFGTDKPTVLLIPDKEFRSPMPSFDHSPVLSPVEIDRGSDARDRHRELVTRAVDAIKEGNMEKVVLSRVLEVPADLSRAIDYFKVLLGRYPGAFRYLWVHPETGCWMGATPETLAKMTGNTLTTMSLAATRRYEGSLEVSWGVKEIEEQALVTRSILENLKPYCSQVKAGPVETVKAGSLLHLRTEVTALLNADKSTRFSVVEALHPTPAVCGLPKTEALNFINANEGYAREYYTGYLGLVTKEEVRLFVNLRCMQIQTDHANIYVGGGITAMSDSQAEWEETVQKSKIMSTVLAGS